MLVPMSYGQSKLLHNTGYVYNMKYTIHYIIYNIFETSIIHIMRHVTVLKPSS